MHNFYRLTQYDIELHCHLATDFSNITCLVAVLWHILHALFIHNFRNCCSGSQTIEITWAAPNKKYETFVVRYKEKKSDSDFIFKTTKTESCTLQNLKSETEYNIIICGIDDDDELKLFETMQSTIKSPASKLKDESEYEGQVDGSVSIYRMQLKEDIVAPGIMRYTLGL